MLGILYAGQPGTSDADVVENASTEGGPFGAPLEVKSASVCNSTGAAATLTVKVQKASGVERFVYSAQSIAAGATVALSALVGLVLANGDQIHMLAGTAAALDVVISGTEVEQFTS
jgi:hypothetical protein